jgi:uncharacterized protein (DUF1697 family)
MTRCVVLLRAINVGGRNRVPMADLRELAGQIGLADAKTLLQSGNLLVEAGQRAPAVVEAQLEQAITERFGLSVGVMVRSADAWHDAITNNPYPDIARTDPSHLVLMCAKASITSASLAILRAAINGRETVAALARELYVTYPDGIGTSKLTTTVIERHLGTSVTGRNWRTVLKIAEALN